MITTHLPSIFRFECNRGNIFLRSSTGTMRWYKNVTGPCGLYYFTFSRYIFIILTNWLSYAYALVLFHHIWFGCIWKLPLFMYSFVLITFFNKLFTSGQRFLIYLDSWLHNCREWVHRKLLCDFINLLENMQSILGKLLATWEKYYIDGTKTFGTLTKLLRKIAIPAS